MNASPATGRGRRQRETHESALMWFQRNRLPVDWQAQRDIIARFRSRGGIPMPKKDQAVTGKAVTIPGPAGGVKLETFIR